MLTVLGIMPNVTENCNIITMLFNYLYTNHASDPFIFGICGVFRIFSPYPCLLGASSWGNISRITLRTAFFSVISCTQSKQHRSPLYVACQLCGRMPDCQSRKPAFESPLPLFRRSGTLSIHHAPVHS